MFFLQSRAFRTESGVKGNANSDSAKDGHNYLLIGRNAPMDYFCSFHDSSSLEMTVEWYIRNCYSFGGRGGGRRKKTQQNNTSKREMSWLGKNNVGKSGKKHVLQVSAETDSLLLSILQFFTRKHEFRCATDQTSICSASERRLYLPKNVKTEQARGWWSDPTSPSSPPVLRWQHCKVISDIIVHIEKQERFHSSKN